MLNRQHRFHGYGSLRRVYSKSKSIRSPLLSLRYAERGQGRPYRVAVVVGRKVNKSAVVRNRIRRRVYEVIRLSDNVPPSTDLIFTVFSDQLKDLRNEELVTLVNQLLIKTQETVA